MTAAPDELHVAVSRIRKDRATRGESFRHQRGCLHDFGAEVQSVGTHKGVMISTARFQQGAIEFAKVHGIALVAITEGRFTFAARSRGPGTALSREEAHEMYGISTFVGYSYEAGDAPDSINRTVISTDYPEYVQTLLLGIPESPIQ